VSTKASSKSTGTSYRFVGDHATEFALEGGARVQVGPGDFIELSDAEYQSHPEHQAWLLNPADVQPTKEELDALKESQAEETTVATDTTEGVTTSDAG